MIRYKINIIQAFKDAGYTTYQIQKNRLLSASTMQKIRHDDTSLTIDNLNTICDLLRCQPGDLLEWYPAEETQEPAASEASPEG